MYSCDSKTLLSTVTYKKVLKNDKQKKYNCIKSQLNILEVSLKSA